MMLIFYRVHACTHMDTLSSEYHKNLYYLDTYLLILFQILRILQNDYEISTCLSPFNQNQRTSVKIIIQLVLIYGEKRFLKYDLTLYQTIDWEIKNIHMYDREKDVYKRQTLKPNRLN